MSRVSDRRWADRIRKPRFLMESVRCDNYTLQLQCGVIGQRATWKVPSCLFGIKPNGTEQHRQVGKEREERNNKKGYI